MKSLSISLVLFSLTALPRHSIAQARAQSTSDSLVFDLASSVPGREVRFRIVGSNLGARLTASQLDMHADTLVVTTPARLALSSRLTAPDIRLEVESGEPWLHARTIHDLELIRQYTLDVYGHQLTIRRANGHATLYAAVLRMTTTPPQ